MGKRSYRSTCPVYRTVCTEHGWVHGAEAEELRKAIEVFIAKRIKPSPNRLQRMLDDIDARDSLAHVEAVQDKVDSPSLAEAEVWYLVRNDAGEYLTEAGLFSASRRDAYPMTRDEAWSWSDHGRVVRVILRRAAPKARRAS